MMLRWRAVSRPLEFVFCQAMVAFVSFLVFTPLGQPWIQPLTLMPALAWASLGFTWTGTITALVIILGAATIGTNPYAVRVSDTWTAEMILGQVLLVATGFGIALAYFTSVQRHHAAKLSELLATVDLGIFMARDLDGTIRFWSKGAQRLYGWSPEEAVGRISHELLQTIHPIPLAEIDRAVLELGEWTGDLQHTTKSGEHLIVVARKVRRDVKNGHTVTLLEVLHNVTEERADQAKLVELTHTLEQRIATEVASREAVQERVKRAQHMHALGKVAAGVAHEFNNILQAVHGGLTIIEQHPADTSRVQRFARIAISAAERGALITRRLLNFAGRATFHQERIEPVMVLDALRDILTHTLGGKVQIVLDIQSMLPPIVVDRHELETALINLATNGRDAMPDGGILTLAVQTVADPPDLAPGRYIRFSVTDCGIGMDPTTLRRSTEPFFTTKPIGSGTGLGLSMVKGFAEQSGGGLAIDSAPGAGTTVTLWLPVTDTEVRPAPLQPAALGSQARFPSGGRVLLVDDEEMVRETLRFGLEEAGYQVLVAASGTAALALLGADELVDVMVTDYAMPGMDGLALIREVRARRPTLPTLILTGYVESVGSATTEQGLNTVLGVLRKPVTISDLSRAIAAVIGAARQGRSPPPLDQR